MTERMTKMAGKKNENQNQQAIGGEDAGFIKSIRETDSEYLKAVEGYSVIESLVKALSAERDEVLKEKMAEVTPYRLSVNRRIGMLQRLSDAMKLNKAMAEARVCSMESPASYTVLALSPKGRLRDWLYVKNEDDLLSLTEDRDPDDFMALAVYKEGNRIDYFIEDLMQELASKEDGFEPDEYEE